MNNKTTFIRVEKNKNYTVIHNEFLRRGDLSWKAKGMLAYILSLPDDWTINLDEIARHSTDGKSSFQSGWKELRDAGYVSRVPVKDHQTKKIIRWETIVRETADTDKSHKPKTHSLETQSMENQTLENQTLLSTDSTKDLDILSTEGTKDSEKFPAAASEYLEKSLGSLTPFMIEDLQFYNEKFKEPNEIIKEAIDISIARGKRNWNYTKAIVRSWQGEGLQTLEDVKAFERDKAGGAKTESIDPLSDMR